VSTLSVIVTAANIVITATSVAAELKSITILNDSAGKVDLSSM